VIFLGIIDKMEKEIEEMDKKSEQNMEELFKYLMGLDIVGLDVVLLEIRDIMESGFYEKLITASNQEKFNSDIDFLGDLPKHRIEILAYDNLKKGGLLTTIFTKSIITVQDTLTLYSFMESVYYMYKSPLEKEDMMNIYFSGLDERIIFALDNFNTVKLEDLPEPTPEYIKSLGKTYWEEKELYKKLNKLMFEVMDFILDYPDIKDWSSKYRSTEDLFVQFLAACSAVNDGRLGIGINDTVKAYTTFLKLIKTDVTMYKAIPERISDLDNHSNYLVCKSCGNYYQIPEGESKDDYSDICECGGKLKYLG
jgi:hypothetical protein